MLHAVKIILSLSYGLELCYSHKKMPTCVWFTLGHVFEQERFQPTGRVLQKESSGTSNSGDFLGLLCQCIHLMLVITSLLYVGRPL